MDTAEVIKQADELENQSKWEAELELLKPFEDKTEDVELLWRLIRVYNWVGAYHSKDKPVKKERAKKVQEISDRAMKADNNHFDVLRVGKSHCLLCDICRQTEAVYFRHM